MPDTEFPAAWRGARYVALGSSYAAGPGLGQRAPGSVPEARRTIANYPHLLAAKMGLNLVDATSSGAVTADICWARQYGQPPQANALTPDTQLVTVTVGGNDIGYAGRLVLAGMPLTAVPQLRLLYAARALLKPGAAPQSLAALPAAMLLVAQLIRRRSPQATVLFVEYLTVLPPDPGFPVPQFTARQAAAGRQRLAALQLATAAAAQATGCGVVPVTDASAGHHAWSPEPWTTGAVPERGLDDPLPFHPNRAGMAAVTDLIEQHLTRVRTGAALR